MNDLAMIAWDRSSLRGAARGMAPSVALVGILAAGALFIGVSGYHWVAGLGWVDSLLNASMILGGMGPVDPLPTAAAKVFASAYALFSGLLFIAVMGIVLAPITHMVLHRFHVDEKDLSKKVRGSPQD
jgi:hypothetical protein